MEKIKNKIDELLAQKDMVVMVIDGKCTSGKTTLAAKLAEVYDCNVDYERFKAEVLIPLQAGQPFSYRPFDCSTFTLAEPVCVTPRS